MTDGKDDHHADSTETHAAFTNWAAQAGLIAAGDPLPPKLLAFAFLIVDACASIADAYGDDDAGGSAGEHIRAELFE